MIPQLIMFGVSAVASGIAFRRWKRLSGESKLAMWRLYGLFTGLICCGSFFGAGAWGSNMKQLELYFIASHDASKSVMTQETLAQLNADSYRWWAAYFVLYSLEFLCLSVAKLAILDRMLSFAATTRTRRLNGARRLVMFVVVAGNSAGVAGNIATAVYLGHAADYCSAAAQSFRTNLTVVGNELNSQSNYAYQSASEAMSIQRFSEVAVLLVITASFVAAGCLCSTRIRSALRELSKSNENEVDVAAIASASGHELFRKVFVTVSVVFITFLLRAAYSIMNAFTAALQNVHVGCPSLCVWPCNNRYALMQTYLTFRIELSLAVILISSPTALLIALWGMSSVRVTTSAV